jgi:hypothetical protein
VLNRFLMQAAIGYPLSVHGTGGQTRAFIHIRDSVRCVQLALENPPEREKVKIFNQMTESHQVGELAKKVAHLTGAQINYLPNPRKEAIENDLIVDNRCFIEMGLKPTTLDDGLLSEVVDVARRWAEPLRPAPRFLVCPPWTTTQAAAIPDAGLNGTPDPGAGLLQPAEAYHPDLSSQECETKGLDPRPPYPLQRNRSPQPRMGFSGGQSAPCATTHASQPAIVRIAFFTETFLPKVDGIVTRLTKTLEHLVAAGDEVMIFCPEGAPETYLGARGGRRAGPAPAPLIQS